MKLFSFPLKPVSTAPSVLLCKNTLLRRPVGAPFLGHVSTRASSMSAIHRGLRTSEKNRAQGFDRKSLRTKPLTRRAREAGWTPPTFTIKKGKKDITDQGPQAPSRRKRFNDPDSSFGKKSLVYQMNTAVLRDRMSELPGASDDTPKSAFRSARDSPYSSRRAPPMENRGRGFTPNRSQRSYGDQERDSVSGRPEWPRKDSGQVLGSKRSEWSRKDDRQDFASRRSEWPRKDQDRDFRPERPDRPQNSYQRSPRPERDAQGTSRTWGDRNPNDIVRIHHTTAASQFLYGRSVVEAALNNARRQLYRLYIYSGEDRRNVNQDADLERLATRLGVKTIRVESEGLRMMDKMSGGRPHNGCILEASPLPQAPLKGLGAVSEDPQKPGYSIMLSHQTEEEVAINGKADFIDTRLPPGRNPFVLLLEGILDPGNLGAILRTAAFLGVNAVAVSTHGSATLTPVALKASAGATEAMTIFSVSSTIDFLNRSKEEGWMTYAAVPEGPRTRSNSHVTLNRVEDYDPLSTSPTILIMGSEGEGLTKRIRREADHEVSIPNGGGMLSGVDSLNVSVATGILCSTFLRKQKTGMETESTTDEKKDDENQLW